MATSFNFHIQSPREDPSEALEKRVIEMSGVVDQETRTGTREAVNLTVEERTGKVPTTTVAHRWKR